MRRGVRRGRGTAATIDHAGRVTAGRCEAFRGKSGHPRAGRWGDPGGESRRKVAQKGDRQRRSISPETPKVRVKRWGKSPPASWRHGGWPNPVRCKAKQAPSTLPAEEPGTPHRWMVTLDRI